MIRILAATVLIVTLAAPVLAGPPATQPAVTPATTQAVEKALDWLAERQQRDGSFAAKDNQPNVKVALTSIAGLAFAAGDKPAGRGRHDAALAKAVEFVLASGDEKTGLLAAQATGPMYQHAFATTLLARVLVRDPKAKGAEAVRKALARAVDLIIASQGPQGGWRYQPIPQDADMSVTSCEMSALWAAWAANMVLPKATVARAVRYTLMSQAADGGFSYTIPPAQGRASSLACSAGGLTILLRFAGDRKKEIEQARQCLARFRTQLWAAEKPVETAHFLYAQYFAAQALCLAGGDDWEKWYPALRDQLLDRQEKDGSWQAFAAGIGPEYATALAVILLGTPNDTWLRAARGSKDGDTQR